MENKSVAVFDFDGTVVSKVTAYVFYKWLIKMSWIRIVLFFLFLPVVLILITNSITRKHGFSVISYIATSFRKQSLFSIRSSFMDYYFTRSDNVVFKDAVDKIKDHLKKGDEVVILSGCPQWLLYTIVKCLGFRGVRCIGSELTMGFTGLLFKNHCYSAKKLEIALEKGISLLDFTYGYTDSISDAPWLKYCSEVHAINQDKRGLLKLKRLLDNKIISLKWS